MVEELRTAVVGLHGETTTYLESWLNAAYRHEARFRMYLRLLRQPGLTVEQQAMLIDKLGAATESRQRAVEKLGIEVKGTADPWQQYDASQQSVLLPQPASQPAPPDAAQATPDALEAIPLPLPSSCSSTTEASANECQTGQDGGVSE